jgi:hypothetical protein
MKEKKLHEVEWVHPSLSIGESSVFPHLSTLFTCWCRYGGRCGCR